MNKNLLRTLIAEGYITETVDPLPKKFEDFEKFLDSKYIYEGQEIYGADNLYKALKLKEYSSLVPLVMGGGKRKLTTTSYTLSTDEEALLKLISSTIRISNGEPSELWFAIMYKGRVKGGVAGETGIVSDVDVKDSAVSLKNYGTGGKKIPSSIDFGTLDRETSIKFNQILDLFKMLTSIAVTPSITVASINKLLEFFSSKENINDINNFIKMSNDSNIGVIRRYGDRIRSVIGNKNATTLVPTFISSVNSMIESKLNKVDWWAVILSNKQVYIHSSESLIKLYTSTGNKLSPNLANFKGGHLYINASSIRKSQ